jgi:hypothetical protein
MYLPNRSSRQRFIAEGQKRKAVHAIHAGTASGYKSAMTFIALLFS